MASQFGALFDIQPASNDAEPRSVPAAPQKAFPRTYHSVPLPQSQEAFELVDVQHATQSDRPRVRREDSASGELDDLEMSRPASPVLDGQDAVEAMQSFSSPPMNRYRLVSVSLMAFLGGLNDSAPGTLIPYMEKHYNIGYAIVALIFVTTALGFISAAFFVEALRSRVGRAKTFGIANVLICSGYVAIACTPPWPVVVLSYLLLGLGLALNLALSNFFAANLQNATRMLGIVHGSYGVGGIIGPLISTAMASSGMIWSRYFLFVLGVAFFNLIFSVWSFWNYEAETPAALIAPQDQSGNTQSVSSQFKDMLKAFKNKVVILGALFIFAYQGAEVSISGWVISFLISARNGNPSSVGYVTAGFWSGITLGRFLLSPIAHRVGEKPFVYVMIVGSGIFELLVWQIPNVVGDAVALAIVGLLLGPVYPCGMVIFTKDIKRKEQVSGLSVISAFGSSGGAVAPFTTGILAQAAGAFVLHPIAIALFACMTVCWFALPRGRKRTE